MLRSAWRLGFGRCVGTTRQFIASRPSTQTLVVKRGPDLTLDPPFESDEARVPVHNVYTCFTTIYRRNLLGWLETRLAQRTLNYLK